MITTHVNAEQETRLKTELATYFRACFFLGLFFNPED
jgi:hypothetical protein